MFIAANDTSLIIVPSFLFVSIADHSCMITFFVTITHVLHCIAYHTIAFIFEVRMITLKPFRESK